MNQQKQKLILRNSIFLLLFILICAALSRCAHGGETLTEHQASVEEPISDYHQKKAESPVDTDVPTQPAQPQPMRPAQPIQSTQSMQPTQPVQVEGDPAMPDRIYYQDNFFYESLNETIRNRITGISYPLDDTNAQIQYDDLCYVSVLYYNFDDKEAVGELICNKAIAQDLVEIFYELYCNHYEIEQIHLVDEYQGNDDLSMMDNNTSCFNYRTIEGKNKLSNHAYGLAIDINPFYNPYVTYSSDASFRVSPAGSEYYADRSKAFAYKITHDDLAYQLFTEHGFTWGGDWNSSKDYQHFEKK